MESTESNVAKIFNKCYVNIANFLGIINIHEQEPLDDQLGDNSLAIVERYETHKSIIKIKSSVNNTIKLSFRKITTGHLVPVMESSAL